MYSPYGANGSPSERTAIVARVVTDAKHLYRDLADEVVLEQCAHRAMDEIWTSSIRVTSFVPVLALRQIREVLAGAERRPIPDTAASVTTPDTP